jgi:threonine synthase
MKRVFNTTARLVDPHTAVALAVAERFADPARPMLVCSTAHFAKFPLAALTAAGARSDERSFSDNGSSGSVVMDTECQRGLQSHKLMLMLQRLREMAPGNAIPEALMHLPGLARHHSRIVELDELDEEVDRYFSNYK